MNKKLPEWDLSNLYKSLADPKIKADINESENLAVRFAKQYRGKLTSIKPGQMKKAFADLEQISETLVRPDLYAFLLFSLDSSDPKIGAFYQQVKTDTVHIEEHLIFFELELIKLSAKQLNELKNSKELSDYKRYLTKLIEEKEHRLEEGEEKILNQKYLTSRSAFVRLYDQIMGKKKFTLKHKGKTRQLLETEVLNLRYSPDRSLRKAAAEAFSAGLKELSEYLVYIYNVLIQDTQINERLLKFKNLADSRHLDNEIDAKSVELMCDTVISRKSVIQDYFKFKAKVLGLPVLKHYDTLAPITREDGQISYPKLKKTIQDAFSEFHPEYAKAAEKFFAEGKIDFPVRKGKANGAFCIGASPKSPSYILVNFTGKNKDLSTVAHELGHGINNVFMSSQNSVNFSNPTILAEVASLFSEMILFDHEIKTAKTNSEKISLYADKIEDLSGNIFRGVSVYQFEYQAHAHVRDRGELTGTEIGKLWTMTQQSVYGKSVDYSGDYSYWWSYIGHLYHFAPPFYYYGYAFGALTALAMYGQYKEAKNKDEFVKKYHEFLSAGSSLSPQDRLAKFGFDTHDKNFWATGLDALAGMVKEIKKLQLKSN